MKRFFKVFLSVALVAALTLPILPTIHATDAAIWVEYYNGKFAGFVKGQNEAKIDNLFSATNQPAGMSSHENFSVKYFGCITAPESGEYVIRGNFDDGAKLIVDNKLLINDVGPHFPLVSTAKIVLTAGKQYSFSLEYYNGALAGTAILSWTKPNGTTEVIPASQYSTPKKARTDIKVSGTQLSVSANLHSNDLKNASLVTEKYSAANKLIEKKTKAYTGNTLKWESDKMDYSTGHKYKAYVTDNKNNVISDVATKTHGVNTELTIDKDDANGKITPFMSGACIEDVNHELYGGIWSQLIFGESFAEPANASIDGFQSAGGSWGSSVEGGDTVVTVSNQNDGPKLMLDNSTMTTGEVSADVWFNGDGPAGFIVKTTDASPGADNFNGYEIGIKQDKLALGRHQKNYTDLGEYDCDAASGTWVNIRVVMQATSFTVYVNDTEITTYNSDTAPFQTGAVGLRAWRCDAKYKNIQLKVNNGSVTNVPISTDSDQISGMWRKTEKGSAVGSAGIATNAPYKGLQSQSITFSSGTGSIGVNNMSLNRKGMNFEANKEYQGYFYARSSTPATAYVVAEKADGSVSYAETSVNVSGTEFTKYSFTLTPDQKDSAGRLSIELRSAGTIDLGYVYFEPGEWGRFEGLPVRKDVADRLVEQGLTFLRFGGCMANAEDYKWKSMLGAPETRPTYNGWWYPQSSFGFGIIEFLDLCEKLGIDAVPDFNGYETAEDMADFIDFATGTDTTNVWVQKRIEMGHPEPYDLPYLQYGNEERVNDDYATRFNQVAEKIWEKAPNVILVVGDFAYEKVITDPYNFSGAHSGITTLAPHKKIMDFAVSKNKPVWFDVHVWTDRVSDAVPYFDTLESLYVALKSISPNANVKLPIFELNANTHTVARALANAYSVSESQRLSDIIPMVASANCLQVDGHNDNSWDQGLVFMNNDSTWFQPPAYITQMVTNAHNETRLDVAADQHSDKLNVNATKNDDGNSLAISLVNQNTSGHTVKINLPKFTGNINNAKITTLSGNLGDRNTATNPERIKPTTTETANAVIDNSMTITLKANSYTTIIVTKLSEYVEPKSGWVNENGKSYYYVNGELMRNQWVNDNRTDSNGAMITDSRIVVVSGKSYILISGKRQNGTKFVSSNKNSYYIKNGVILKGKSNTRVKLKKKYYIINKNGVRVTGTKFVKVGKKNYYIKKGIIVTGKKNKMLVVKKARYVLNKSGQRLQGNKIIKIAKRQYFVNKKGVVATKKKVIYKKKTYYANAKGVLRTKK